MRTQFGIKLWLFEPRPLSDRLKKGIDNVLGVSPQSTFWDGLQKSIYFKDNRFAMRICYYPNFESLQINYQVMSDQMMIEVPVQNSQFEYQGQLNVKDQQGHMVQKDLSVCIQNSKNLLFQTTKGIYQLIMNKLCAEPLNCVSLNDLKTFDDKEIAFEIFAKASFLNFESANNLRST